MINTKSHIPRDKKEGGDLLNSIIQNTKNSTLYITKLSDVGSYHASSLNLEDAGKCTS